MANKKYSKGEFVPRNPEKYVGTYPILFRSSWELAFMHFVDKNQNFIQWASESVKIPYYNPLTKRMSTYIPDFLVNYVNKHGESKIELIEIMPVKQAIMEKARGTRGKQIVLVNHAKWEAARKWCAKKGLTFRVMTEINMFAQNGKL